METKDITELTLEDFERYSKWTLSDDLNNEDEVMPCPCECIDVEGVFFISSRFYLKDGSIYHGYIRVSWAEITTIALAANKTKFLHFSLMESVRNITKKTHKDFAKKIGKKNDEVFPILYQTESHFCNGEKISGSID